MSESLCGIWQGGGITAVDPGSFFYFETGNGSFNTNPANFNAQGFPIDGNYGDCFVQLKIGLDPAKARSQSNTNGFGEGRRLFLAVQQCGGSTDVDRDLGSGGPLILPDSANARSSAFAGGCGKGIESLSD